jgi:cell division septation protein DedD
MTVQKTIIQGISELLYNNDYVVVPGFGGFVAKHQLAHYSVNKSVLHPPSKKVLFNIQLKQNDGILAGWLKEKLNCDFNEVNKHLEEFSNYSKMLLDTKRRLEFENLGLFYLDFENNICFEPKADINFLIESFGLSSIALREIEAEVPVEKKEIETIDRFALHQAEDDKKPIKKRNYKRIAALVVGIPFITVALMLAVTQIQPNSNFAANVLGLKGSSTNYSTANYNNNLTELNVPAIEPYAVDANGYSSVKLFEEDKLITVNISAPDKTEVKAKHHTIHVASPNLSGKFQIVLGAFGIEANAHRLIKKLAKQNVKAGVNGVNAKGLHIVSGGGFNDKDSATAFLISIKDKCPSAWIMSQ